MKGTFIPPSKSVIFPPFKGLLSTVSLYKAAPLSLVKIIIVLSYFPVSFKCLIKSPTALSKAIINWRITSNQSRTFSLIDTLAISISENANLIGSSIRAKLSNEDSGKALPVIEEEMDNVKTFVTLQAAGYVQTKTESVDAIVRAEQELFKRIMEFDFENQLAK